MPNDKHPLDVVAEQLEELANRPVETHEPSPDWWELRCATDESVGDYPQAIPKGPFLEENSDGLGPDGFPAVPIPEQVLQPTARWTDVLSSNLWSEGLLFNEKALAVFKQCNLGEFREYPAIVRDKARESRSLTYLHFCNDIPTSAIDFERSEFYLADMLGGPKSPVEINSFDDWLERQDRAFRGKLDGCKKYSRIAYKTLFFRRGHQPSIELFTLERLGITVYISTRLRNLIISSGITGLEIRPNKRLFATP